MTQLCLYLDRDLYKRMEARAKEKDMSLSGFVREALKGYMDSDWPEDITGAAGSLKDDAADVPERSTDASRKPSGRRN